MKLFVLLVAALVAGVLLAGCGSKGGPAAAAPASSTDKALEHLGKVMKEGGAAEEETKAAVESTRAFFKAAGEAEAARLADCVLTAAAVADVKGKCGDAFAAATLSARDKIIQAQEDKVRAELQDQVK